MTMEPKAAVEAAIKHVIDNPLSHDQGYWTLHQGSVRCISGWILHYAEIPINENPWGLVYVPLDPVPGGFRDKISIRTYPSPTEVLSLYLDVPYEEALTLVAEPENELAIKRLKGMFGLC